MFLEGSSILIAYATQWVRHVGTITPLALGLSSSLLEKGAGDVVSL